MIKIKTKSYDEIKKTLSRRYINKNNPDELFFNPEMEKSCGEFIDIPYPYILSSIAYCLGKNRIYTPNWTWHYEWIEKFIVCDANEVEILFLANNF